MVVLGFEVDNVHWVMCLPDAKVREYQQSINEWTAHRAVTSRDTDSLLGKAWYDRVELLWRLVDLRSRVGRITRTIHVDDSAHADIL